MGMHYERAARDEAALQKTVEKKNLKSGEEEKEQRERECLWNALV